jgi:RsiW-degrading membrane proteinase PrsW (M82 family)
MLIIYSIIAIFIAWIWIDYYRLIDIYESEKLKYIMLTFVLGAASVFIVDFIDRVVLSGIQFDLKGTFINDFLYCVFKIGCVEEFAKIIPFAIVFFLFRKEINEPIDYIVYISVSALGFSAAENILYFHRHGAGIITGRAILSTVGHMFNTSLFAYGFICYRFYDQKKNIFMILFFFFLAALSHGFYDFWLLYEKTKSGGWLITVTYFLITISIFATIMNNALNNSSFFTYKKIIASNRVASRMLLYYVIVFFMQFALTFYQHGYSYVVASFRGSLFITGFVVVVAVVRLSRFKLIQGRWQRIKIEFPFSIYTGSIVWGTESNSGFRLRIKGESYDEVCINTYYEAYFLLNPLQAENSYLKNARLAFIEKKIFLKNDEAFYVTRIFSDEQKEHFELVLIKPKTSKRNMVDKQYPIVAILKIENLSDIDDLDRGARDFKFQEWAFAKPHRS